MQSNLSLINQSIDNLLKGILVQRILFMYRRYGDKKGGGETNRGNHRKILFVQKLSRNSEKGDKLPRQISNYLVRILLKGYL